MYFVGMIYDSSMLQNTQVRLTVTKIVKNRGKILHVFDGLPDPFSTSSFPIRACIILSSFLFSRTAKGRHFEEPLSPSMPGFTGSTIYIPTQQPPTVREQQLEAEVRRLRVQLDAAAAKDAGQSASSPLSICQRYKCGNGAPPGSSWAGTRKQQLKIGNRVAHTGCAEHMTHLQGTRLG